MIPYGRQVISEQDIDVVAEVLKSDWLTTGPKVNEFEQALSDFTGAQYAVTFSSGTAALHAAMSLINVGPGDEVIVAPITFVATANCVVYQGATPVFSDVNPNTLLLDPRQVRKNITPKTKAIIAMDYAGQACDYIELRKICVEYNLVLIADACHSLGAENDGVSVGCLADITVLSFHPVKHICTGEGGALLLHTQQHAIKAKKFRNHGISTDHHQRKTQGTWDYDMDSLGFNYRLTDFQCALGMNQLKTLPAWLNRRREVAQRYDIAFDNLNGVNSLTVGTKIKHAYHLYVVRIDQAKTGISRDLLFTKLRQQNIGVNVHYKPVYEHSYYKRQFPNADKNCIAASKVAKELLSIPIYGGISDQQVDTVIHEITTIVSKQ